MEETPGNTALGNSNDTTNSEDAAATIDWEKRYKDTQKNIQDRSIENKSLQAEKDALAKQLAEIKAPRIEITDELDELKYTDPDSWRKEINRLEQEALKKSQIEQREVLEAARHEAVTQGELDRRLDVFKSFQDENPGLKIDDNVLASDVPPRISRKLENNEITFEEFLSEVKTYLTAERVTTKEPLQKDPNLGKVAGGSTPSMEAKLGEAKTSYVNEIY